MSRHRALQCDLTGESIAQARIPIVVRLSVAVAPGALRDPTHAELSPFLRAMLFWPDGSPRPGALDLSAEAFEVCFAPDMTKLAIAFSDTKEAPEVELGRLRAENARLRALNSGRTG